MARRSIVKRIAQFFIPEENDAFLRKLPIPRAPIGGDIASDPVIGVKKDSQERQGAAVEGFGTLNSSNYIKTYRNTMKSPAYKNLPPGKQKKFRRQSEKDLTQYRDVI